MYETKGGGVCRVEEGRGAEPLFKAEARRSEGDRACFDSEGEHVIRQLFEVVFVFSRRCVVMVW